MYVYIYIYIYLALPASLDLFIFTVMIVDAVCWVCVIWRQVNYGLT